jgi:predicted nucleic acid-binding protein
VNTVDAVLDASFWINAERSGLLGHLHDFFRLWAPPIVVQELIGPFPDVGTSETDVREFGAWVERGDVQVEAPLGSFGAFDAGENQAIALARERGWVLLIDDAQPRHFSRGVLGLTVIDSPAFTVLLYDQGRLDRAQAIQALNRSQAGQRLRREALVAIEILGRKKEGR